ncbi:MAG: hypothetical protein AB7L66_21600 [Gemmatimonadales bacterium]
MRSKPLATAAVLMAVLTTGCAKRSADSAIARAESEIADLRSEAEKIAPNELKALDDSLGAMKARVEAGDYSGALMGARSIHSLARDLGANLATRKEQLTTSFTTLQNELPAKLEAVTGRLKDLGAMRRLPPGIDANKVAALQTDAAGWASKWTEATQAFAAGNLAAALNAGNEIRSKVAEAMSALQMN